jgi:hypothetical protein
MGVLRGAAVLLLLVLDMQEVVLIKVSGSPICSRSLSYPRTATTATDKSCMNKMRMSLLTPEYQRDRKPSCNGGSRGS